MRVLARGARTDKRQRRALGRAERNVPQWQRFVVNHTALQAAATTATIELFLLPSACVIHAVKLKHSVAFDGGAISAYTLEVGITGTLDKYLSARDVNGAPGATVQYLQGTIGTEDHVDSVSIKITARSTGANTSASTTGKAEVWVLVSYAGA